MICAFTESTSLKLHTLIITARKAEIGTKKEKTSESFCHYSNTPLSAIELDQWAAINLLTIGYVQPMIDYIQSYT